jgi:uncharacterized hydrophobic protein (TIGR00271 family)
LNSLFQKFRLGNEKEEFQSVITSIDNGVVFRGTNLWILIFAIFVASLGLNVNSTAVIIGAMLISPLMGPIMGIGLGMGINDIALLRKAMYNFAVATGVALITSTVFFLVSPLRDAHSELLARTSPNIYDVLIALFGGLAGILATSSKQKGNVIPGVAIATALMPPLCTAGYGLATLQFNFFWGAFYLFIINTVFIALATFVMVRFLHFPEKDLHNAKLTKRAHRIVWGIVILTLLPSIYFGYDMVQQDRFNKNAARFIQYEAHFPNDYLLSKKTDAKTKSILLVFGGKEITAAEKATLTDKLKRYGLGDATLEIKQGFAYLSENNNEEKDEKYKMISSALEEKDKEQKLLQIKFDSIYKPQQNSKQVYAELKVQYPSLKKIIIQPAMAVTDSAALKSTNLILLELTGGLPASEKIKLEKWLKIRLQQENLTIIFQ